MSGKNKNHNRIIFITTLSVYLGLVLVGATPAVLSQSQPAVKSGIKPPDPPILRVRDLKDFQDKIVRLIQSGNLDLSKPFEAKFFADSVKGILTNPKFELIAGDRLIDELQREWFDFVALGVLLSDASTEKASFHISSDGKVITSNLALRLNNSEKAALFASGYNKAFSDERAKGKPNYQYKLVFENTKVSSENNQVFIVTRLPRAAIDEFLATNAH